MTTLVACVSSGKRELGHVSRLISEEKWDKVILIDDGTADLDVKAEVVKVDTNRTLSELVEDLKKGLNGKVQDTEAGINLIAGSGKMHMAVISALLKLGLGIRLVALTKEGVKEV